MADGNASHNEQLAQELHGKKQELMAQVGKIFKSEKNKDDILAKIEAMAQAQIEIVLDGMRPLDQAVEEEVSAIAELANAKETLKQQMSHKLKKALDKFRSGLRNLLNIHGTTEAVQSPDPSPGVVSAPAALPSVPSTIPPSPVASSVSPDAVPDQHPPAAPPDPAMASPDLMPPSTRPEQLSSQELTLDSAFKKDQEVLKNLSAIAEEIKTLDQTPLGDEPILRGIAWLQVWLSEREKLAKHANGEQLETLVSKEGLKSLSKNLSRDLKIYISKAGKDIDLIKKNEGDRKKRDAMCADREQAIRIAKSLLRVIENLEDRSLNRKFAEVVDRSSKNLEDEELQKQRAEASLKDDRALLERVKHVIGDMSPQDSQEATSLIRAKQWLEAWVGARGKSGSFDTGEIDEQGMNLLPQDKDSQGLDLQEALEEYIGGISDALQEASLKGPSKRTYDLEQSLNVAQRMADRIEDLYKRHRAAHISVPPIDESQVNGVRVIPPDYQSKPKNVAKSKPASENIVDVQAEDEGVQSGSEMVRVDPQQKWWNQPSVEDVVAELVDEDSIEKPEEIIRARLQHLQDQMDKVAFSKEEEFLNEVRTARDVVARKQDEIIKRLAFIDGLSKDPERLKATGKDQTWLEEQRALAKRDFDDIYLDLRPLELFFEQRNKKEQKAAVGAAFDEDAKHEELKIDPQEMIRKRVQHLEDRLRKTPNVVKEHFFLEVELIYQSALKEQEYLTKRLVKVQELAALYEKLSKSSGYSKDEKNAEWARAQVAHVQKQAEINNLDILPLEIFLRTHGRKLKKEERADTKDAKPADAAHDPAKKDNTKTDTEGNKVDDTATKDAQDTKPKDIPKIDYAKHEARVKELANLLQKKKGDTQYDARISDEVSLYEQLVTAGKIVNEATNFEEYEKAKAGFDELEKKISEGELRDAIKMFEGFINKTNEAITRLKGEIPTITGTTDDDKKKKKDLEVQLERNEKWLKRIEARKQILDLVAEGFRQLEKIPANPFADPNAASAAASSPDTSPGPDIEITDDDENNPDKSTSAEGKVWEKYEAFKGNVSSRASEEHPHENQDNHVVDDVNGVYAVLDGVGGSAAGAVASELASKHIVSRAGELKDLTEQDEIFEKIESILQGASAAIDEEVAKNPVYNGMGTTVALIKIVETPQGERTAFGAYAGDSRIYVKDPDGSMRLATLDHTPVLTDIKNVKGPETAFRLQGILSKINSFLEWEALSKKTPDELQTLGFSAEEQALIKDDEYRFPVRTYFQGPGGARNVIDSYLGVSHQRILIRLKPGQELVLTTDGIHDNLNQVEISLILQGKFTELEDKELVTVLQGITDSMEALTLASQVRARQGSERSKKDDMTALKVGAKLKPQPAAAQAATANTPPVAPQPAPPAPPPAPAPGTPPPMPPVAPPMPTGPDAGPRPPAAPRTPDVGPVPPPPEAVLLRDAFKAKFEAYPSLPGWSKHLSLMYKAWYNCQTSQIEAPGLFEEVQQAKLLQKPWKDGLELLDSYADKDLTRAIWKRLSPDLRKAVYPEGGEPSFAKDEMLSLETAKKRIRVMFDKTDKILKEKEAKLKDCYKKHSSQTDVFMQGASVEDALHAAQERLESEIMLLRRDLKEQDPDQRGPRSIERNYWNTVLKNELLGRLAMAQINLERTKLYLEDLQDIQAITASGNLKDLVFNKEANEKILAIMLRPERKEAESQREEKIKTASKLVNFTPAVKSSTSTVKPAAADNKGGGGGSAPKSFFETTLFGRTLKQIKDQIFGH